MATMSLLSAPKYVRGLNTAQKRIIDSIYRNAYTYVVGGWGAGKSTAASYAVALQCLKWEPGVSGLVLAPTFDMMRDLVVARLREVIPPSLLEVHSHGSGELGPHMVVTLPRPGRSPVQTLIRMRVEAAASKVDGFDAGWIYCEEAQSCPTVWQRAQGRLRGPGQNKRAWLVGIPEAGWLESLYRDRFRDGTYDPITRSQWIGVSTRDNTNLEGREAFEARLRAGMTSEQAAMLIDGAFTRHSDSVHPAFVEAQHVVPCVAGLTPHDVVLVGVDFNNDPMTAVFSYRRADTLYVFSELSAPGTTYEHGLRIAAKIREHGCDPSRAKVYPDPAGVAKNHTGSSDFEMLRAAGLNLYPRTSHTRIEERDNSVNYALRSATGEVRLFVDPSCSVLIDSLSTLRRSTRKSAGKDHIDDALGYLVQQEIDAAALAQSESGAHEGRHARLSDLRRRR